MTITDTASTDLEPVEEFRLRARTWLAENVERSDGRRRLLDQHSRHATRQSVVTPHGARLRSGLHEDGIGSPQSVCIEPAVARESYEQARRVAVRVTGGAEHESLAETATEQRDQAYVHTRATRVIDVGVRAR